MDMTKFMKKMQKLQEKMKQAQDKIRNSKYTGEAGNGAVVITMTGNNKITKINIDPSVMVADEKELLEDLLIAAFNDAISKIGIDSKNSVDNPFDDLQLPPFKTP